MLLTLGSPVLPLVYIITATSSDRGKAASTGFSRPSFSTSATDTTLQRPLCATDDALDGVSSSIHMMYFTVSSCPLTSASFFSSLAPQITAVTSVWREANSKLKFRNMLQSDE